MPWLHSLSLRRYPNDYDVDTAVRWIRNDVLANPIGYFAVRTKDAFLIAQLLYQWWKPAVCDCVVCVIAAEHGAVWQVPVLMRESIAWARSRKCRKWVCFSETGHSVAALCKRVGAKETDVRYTLPL